MGLWEVLDSSSSFDKKKKLYIYIGKQQENSLKPKNTRKASPKSIGSKQGEATGPYKEEEKSKDKKQTTPQGS